MSNNNQGGIVQNLTDTVSNTASYVGDKLNEGAEYLKKEGAEGRREVAKEKVEHGDTSDKIGGAGDYLKAGKDELTAKVNKEGYAASAEANKPS